MATRSSISQYEVTRRYSARFCMQVRLLTKLAAWVPEIPTGGVEVFRERPRPDRLDPL